MKRRIDDIPSRAQAKILYDRYRPQYEMAQARLSRTIRRLLSEYGLNVSTRIRFKTFDSYFNKILKFYNEGRRPLAIHDLIGIRIVASFLSELEVIKDILLKNFDILEIETKGAKHSFREFGYDSIHLLIKLPDGIITNEIPYTELCGEVQLRTKLQDAWAEVEHELIYKSDYSLLNEQLKRKLASLNASLTLSDIIFQEIRDYQRERQERDDKRRRTIQEKVEFIENIHGYDKIDESPKPNEKTAEDEISNGSLDKLLFKALDAHAKQDYDTALNYYNRILAANPDDKVCSIISNHRGMVYFVQSNYEKAIEDFTRAIQTNPQNFRAYNNRGLSYRMLRTFDRALEDFDHSIEIDATQAETYFGRAQVFFEMEDYPQALKDCNKVLNIKPNLKSALRFRQVIYSKLF
ncbi:tetratricopeptide repeat protein [candidate division KSB1 bacterium]|nr:tetratricopeptide repeat protein [candidate division KSB1 bacterium]